MTRQLPRVPDAKVALATASVYPESTAHAFEIAARLGYDGVEVMVWTDPVSQDVSAHRRPTDPHRARVLARHAPCLVTPRGGGGPARGARLAPPKPPGGGRGAQPAVVPPPFRW